MSKKKKQRDAMVDDFNTGFLKSMKAEGKAYEKLPAVHDHTKGEYIEEPDPTKER